MNKLWARLTVLVLCCFWATASFAAPGIPALSQPVTDEAQALSPPTKAYLNSELRRLWESGGSQVAVLLIPTLGDETIEGFSIKVAEAWKLGTEKKDNGVLLLIAVQDHKLRIEVGQGNEGVLTDVQSSRIIRNVITPLFKSGDMDNGVVAGVANIVSLTDPQFSFSQGAPASSSGHARHIRGGSLGVGALGFLAPFLPIGFFFLILILAWINRNGRGGGWGGGGGWSSGGGGWSSGGGGGGFSGGGGGFSGGGASGSW